MIALVSYTHGWLSYHIFAYLPANCSFETEDERFREDFLNEEWETKCNPHSESSWSQRGAVDCMQSIDHCAESGYIRLQNNITSAFVQWGNFMIGHHFQPLSPYILQLWHWKSIFWFQFVPQKVKRKLRYWVKIVGSVFQFSAVEVCGRKLSTVFCKLNLKT